MQQQHGADSAETSCEDRQSPAAPIDTGLACLAMLARFHGISAEPAQLAHEFGDGAPFGLTQILLAAKKLGLKAKPVKTSLERLATTPLPAMALGVDGSFFILAKVENDAVLIHDPRRRAAADADAGGTGGALVR
jgi:subfamily B ATP-binding cassette protein HlyB/CyaB